MQNETKQFGAVEMTVEERLKTLYELQTVLSKIDEICKMRGELPHEVQDLEDEIEGLQIRIGNNEDELKLVDADINKWKEEKIVSENAIKKNTEQLENVRNSREYDALSKEIEYQQLEIQLRDKKINEANEYRKERLDVIEDSLRQKAERVEDLENKKSELEVIIAETKMEEDGLRERAKELEMRIDPRLLTSFKRIRKNMRNGLGVVYVQRDACGGCFNKIPPQRQLDIRMRKKIIVCEYCGRIMIDPELAGVEQPKPVEEVVKKTRRRRAAAKEE